MSLRSEWEQEPETPQTMELALVDRYNTANQLMAVGEWDAAIYFFGYVAEMVLKSAYFRVTEPNLAAPIALNAAKTRGQQLQILPNILLENYHSLHFWSAVLCAERNQQGRPLTQATESTLVSSAQVLYQNWIVEMRYHPNRAAETDAEQVREAAEWLFDNRVELGT